jgi:hypothetical protein
MWDVNVYQSNGCSCLLVHVYTRALVAQPMPTIIKSTRARLLLPVFTLFNYICRATWQGVSVAVKRLQLPPGARAVVAQPNLLNNLSLAQLLLACILGSQHLCRATWQGVSVAVKRLQLPPGARALGNAPAAASHSWGPDCSYTVGSMADGRLRPGSGAQPDKRGGLLKQEHMAVQVRKRSVMLPFVGAVYMGMLCLLLIGACVRLCT